MSPAEPRSPRSSRRRAVLDALRAAPGPLGVNEVAERVGIHPNTARFHLDTLVSQGAIDRGTERPDGPGRPRTVYSPHSGMDSGGARDYRLLAEILLSRLASSPSGAQADAVETGRAWGRHLIDRPPPFHRTTAGEALGRLTAMLADLGFEPETEAKPAPKKEPTTKTESASATASEPKTATKPASGNSTDAAAQLIRLRNCPFLELAEEYQATVCPLHLGLMQGALSELGAPVQAGRLEPFAEPGACLAHFTATNDEPTSAYDRGAIR